MKRNLGSGLALGIGIGTAIGVATHNLGAWLAIGIAFGVAISNTGGKFKCSSNPDPNQPGPSKGQ